MSKLQEYMKKKKSYFSDFEAKIYYSCELPQIVICINQVSFSFQFLTGYSQTVKIKKFAIMFKYRITNADWYNGFIKNRGKITLTIMGYFCVEKFQGLHFLRFRLCFVFLIVYFVMIHNIQRNIQNNAYLNENINWAGPCWPKSTITGDRRNNKRITNEQKYISMKYMCIKFYVIKDFHYIRNSRKKG